MSVSGTAPTMTRVLRRRADRDKIALKTLRGSVVPRSRPRAPDALDAVGASCCVGGAAMDGRSGHAWRELVRLLCPPGSTCQTAVCHAPTREIIFGLRPRHPLGPSLDHVVELWEGGAAHDPANLVPAHLTCNVRKSNALRAEYRQQQARSRTSRVRAAADGSRPRRSSSAFNS